MMNKKAQVIPIQTLLIIGLIFLALIFFNVGGLGETIGVQEGSIFSSETFSSERIETTTIYETEIEYVYPNLCNLFQPIIISGDSVNYCNLNGGTWRCDAEFIGCRDLVNPVVDCSGAVVQYSMYQCQSVGGIYMCDPNNAYCYYT